MSYSNRYFSPPISREHSRRILNLLAILSLLLTTVYPGLTGGTLPVLPEDAYQRTNVSQAAGTTERPASGELSSMASDRTRSLQPAASLDSSSMGTQASVNPVNTQKPGLVEGGVVVPDQFTPNTKEAAIPFLPPAALGRPAELGQQVLPAWMNSSMASNPAATDSVELGVALFPEWANGIEGRQAERPLLPELSGNRTGAGASEQALPSWLTVLDPSGAWQQANSTELNGPPIGPAAFGIAACTPAIDLDMQLTPPPYVVSRGNVAGDTYTVTVTNNGSTDTTEVSLYIEPSAGFYYLANSASVTSNLSGTLVYTDTGTGAPGGASTISIFGDDVAEALAPGETFTFTFKLATDANAKSGQLLSVKLLSGDPPNPASPCLTTQENVQTARGNLTILKEPALQYGSFGDVITWTVSLKNTGLGKIYDAVLTDTIGAGYANFSIFPTPAPVDLAVGQIQSYTVSAAVASCTNLTNTAAAAWSIGNADTTATAIDPVSDTVDLILNLEDPGVSVDVAPIPDVTYCGALDVSLPVTVTNTGGAARQLFLTLNASGVSVSLDSGDPATVANWQQSGNTFSYQGGTPAGTLLGGETVVFRIKVTTPNLCNGTTVSVGFTPTFQDACLLMEADGPGDVESNTLPTQAPTLNISKDAPTVVNAGESFVYTITVSGDNQQNIGPGGVTITDVVPSELVINSVSSANGTPVTQTGNTLLWNLPVTGTGVYTEEFHVNVTVPDNAICGAGGKIVNTVIGTADVCPECSLTDSASTTTYVQDPLDNSLNSFTKTSSPVELCGPTTSQLITATLSVGTGITWTNTVYTDSLGASEFAAAMTVVPGTVLVKIDGTDRTSDVNISLGPPLVIDFSNIANILGGFSSSANIVISYQVEAAAGSIVNDAASQTAFLFSEFQLNGPAQACRGDSVGYLGAFTTLKRGDLSVSVAPDAINSCRENDVTLTVTKNTLGTLTDGIVVTFTTDPGDIITPTAPVLGGDFAGQSVTVATGTLPDGRQMVTFTFDAAFDLTGQGTITFPLFRPCSVSSPFDAGITYLDRCDVPRADQNSGGATTNRSDVTLFTTPNEYVVADRQANWRFYVSNSGNIPASNVVVTNSLPVGAQFISYTVNSTSAPQAVIDSVTMISGTDVSGRTVLTFTIPSSPGLPAGSRLRFDVFSQVSTCSLPDDVIIRLAQSCGNVAGVCQGNAQDVVRLLKAPTSLLSSNNQTANLPLCEQGTVDLVVKNTSAKAEEYNFTITDVITNATFVTQTARATVYDVNGQIVTGATSGVLLQNIPFTPTITSLASSEIFTWSINGFPSGTPAYDILAVRQAEDEIHISFQVQTGCDGTAAEVHSFGTATDVCDVPLSFTESSKSLVVDAPELVVQKQVKNVTEGSGFADSVFAGVGDQLVWQVRVKNVGHQRVTNLFVNDTMPGVNAFTLSAVSPITSSQAGATLNWHEAGGQTLAPGATMTYLITGTVASNACTASPVVNEGGAVFGCSVGDLCSATPVTSTASFNTKPSFTLNAINTSLPQCTGVGVLEIRFPNSGARADNVVITYTLPADLKYMGLATGTNPTPDSEPAVGSTGTLTWTYSSIGSETLTNTLKFNVAKSVADNVCMANNTLTGTASLSYQDTCTTAYSDVTANSNTITIRRPDISGTSVSPATQTINAGKRYTWTVSVPNTGNDPAYNLVVTQTLDSGWQNVTAQNGSNGAAPVVSGNTVTWTVGTVNQSTTWTATFSAVAVDGASNYRTTANVHSECDNGSCGQDASAIAYSTPLQSFQKSISKATVSVGEPFSYTISAGFFGNRTYTNAILTDTLPALSATRVFSITRVEIGNINPTNSWLHGPLTGSVLTFTTDLPGASQVAGPDQLAITVTGVISDEPVIGNGDTFNNSVDLGYVEDGQTYAFNTSVPGTLVEPVLAIVKTVNPVIGDAGDTVTYTLQIQHAPSSTATAYDVVISDTLHADLDLVAGSVTTNMGSVSTGNNPGDTWIAVNVPTISLSDIVTVTFQARLADSVTPDATIPNTALLSWDSLPGPGGRPGSASDPASVGTPSPSIAKTLDGTSAAHTNGSAVAVGEVITYALTVTLPEGTNPTVVVTDNLPVGLAYVNGSALVDAAGFAGSVSLVTATSAGGSGDDVVFDFGNVTVTSDNNPGNNSFIVRFRAVTLNTLVNQDGVSHPNTATLHVGTGPVYPSGTVTVTVREPDLAVSKLVDDDTPRFGQRITYTIEVSHTPSSNLDAFDLVVTDTIPAGMSYVPGSASLPANQVNETGIPTVVFTIPALTLTQGSVRFTYQTQLEGLGGSISLGDVLTNSPTVVWTSLPGNEPDERTGGGGVNDYQTSTTETVTVTGPDLQIQKDDGVMATGPGEVLTYTLTILNNGNGAASGITVTDTLPSYVAFVRASNGGAESPAGSGLVSWPSFSLAGGAQLTRTLTVQVDDPLPAGATVITNTATVTDDGTNGPDPTPGNNTDTDSDTLGGVPDLQIYKDDNRTLASPGMILTYTLVITNAGPRGATGVLVTDTLPTYTRFVAASDGGAETSPGSGVVAWPGFSLTGGATVTRQVTIQIDNTLPAGVASLTNTASVADDGTRGPDPTPGDNTDTDVDVLDATPDLVLSKDDGKTYVSPGELVTYTVTISNVGSLGATGVQITDTLPTNTGFVAASDGGSETVTGIVVWPPVSLAAGDQTTRTVTVRVANPLPTGVSSIVNSAMVTDDGTNGVDPTPANNTDSDTDSVTASLGDFVWLDEDADGVQDSGELGVSDVLVRLYDLNNTLVATTTTDANGIYTFTNLIPGDYHVQFVPPTGYLLSPQDSSSTTDALDSDADPTTGATIPTTLDPGEHDPTWDAGLYLPVRVGDKVWYDDDQDGVQDSAEPGVQDVVVTLYNTATGQPVEVAPGLPMTDTTDANGNYLFEGLPPGDYYVVFDLNTLPTGYVVTTKDAGSDDAVDSDADPSTGQSAPTGPLPGGDEDLTLDMGIFLPKASLGDFVWLDEDADGVQDSGELGVSDVLVRLYDLNNTLVATTTTDANGIYTFTNLIPGDYHVQFVPPTGYLLSPQDSSSTTDALDSDADPTTGATIPTTLDPGEHDPTWDAGLYLPVRVGDKVWYDDDQDGVQDSAEPGVQDVVVTLYNTATGQPVEVAPGLPMTDTTDANGNYLFEGLPPGDYYVVFDLNTLPTGYVVTTKDAGSDDAVDSDADPSTGQSAPTGPLPGGDEDLTLDMGIFLQTPVLISTKRDSLYQDLDNDNVPSPGDVLQYQVIITNTGNGPAVNAIFQDIPDNNTPLVSGSVSTSAGTVVKGNQPGDSTVRVTIPSIPVGGQVTITFRVTIEDPLPAGVTRIANQGLISSDNVPPIFTDDPDTPGPDDATATPVTKDPEIQASKTDTLVVDVNNDGFVNPGDTLEYAITLKNTGNGIATGLTISDTLDPNTSLVVGSVQTSAGTIVQGNNSGDSAVVVQIGDLVPGATVTVRYRATVRDPLPAGVNRLYNSAVYTGSNVPGGRTDDPETPVVTDPTGTTVGEVPILEAIKTDSLYTDRDGNGGASPGDTLLYEVTIFNVGTITATNMVFNDTPDPNSTLVPGSVRLNTLGTVILGNGASDSSVAVSINRIPPGGSALLSFLIRINDPLPANVERVSNQGIIQSEETLDLVTDDPETPETDDPTITDLGKPDLLLVKSSDPAPNATIMPGDYITYTLTVRNRGTMTATAVVLTDSAPVGTTYVPDSASPSPASGPDPLVWTVAALAPREVFTASFVVQVNGLGETTAIANVASVSSEELPVIESDLVVNPFDPTAVDLLSLSIVPQDASLSVVWVTGAEVNTWGFHVWRSADQNRAHAQRQTQDMILGKGGPAAGAQYTFLDASVTSGTVYWYWLEEVEQNGASIFYGPVAGKLAASPDEPQSNSGSTHLYLPMITNRGGVPGKTRSAGLINEIFLPVVENGQK